MFSLFFAYLLINVSYDDYFSRTRRAMFEKAFGYIPHFHTVCEKGFRVTLEKVFSRNKHFFQRFRQNILRVGYLKKSKFFIFSCIFLDIRVVRPPFFRGRVELCLEKLINTFNSSMRYVKKFLDWLLPKFSVEKTHNLFRYFYGSYFRQKYIS